MRGAGSSFPFLLSSPIYYLSTFFIIINRCLSTFHVVMPHEQRLPSATVIGFLALFFVAIRVVHHRSSHDGCSNLDDDFVTSVDDEIDNDTITTIGPFPWEPKNQPSSQQDLHRSHIAVNTISDDLVLGSTHEKDAENYIHFLASMTFASSGLLRRPSCPCCQ